MLRQQSVVARPPPLPPGLWGGRPLLPLSNAPLTESALPEHRPSATQSHQPVNQSAHAVVSAKVEAHEIYLHGSAKQIRE